MWTLVSTAVVAILAWFATEFIARPLRTFFDLRKEAKRRMIVYWNAPTSDSYYRSLEGEVDVETYKLDEGRRQLEDIGAQLASFEKPLAAAASELVEKRAIGVKVLSGYVATAYARISGSAEQATLAYAANAEGGSIADWQALWL